MSLTSITDHHRKWEALPAFPEWPYVMTDDDVNVWSDTLYMRGLVDEIENTCVDTGLLVPATLTELACSIEFDIDTYLEPWPTDRAAELLDAWKAAA